MPTELILDDAAFPELTGLIERVLQPLVLQLADESGRWPRRVGDASTMSKARVTRAHVLFVKGAATHLRTLTTLDERLDGRLKTLMSEFAGLPGEQRDLHAAAFPPISRVLPAQFLACLPDIVPCLRLDSIAFQVCVERAAEPRNRGAGLWGSSGVGASRNVLVLVIRGLLVGKRAVLRFALPCNLRPLEPIGPEEEGSARNHARMFARLTDEMLRDLDTAAWLLDAKGNGRAAQRLRQLVVYMDDLDYGAPARRGLLHLTSRTLAVGTCGPLLGAVAARNRSFVVPIGSLEPGGAGSLDSLLYSPPRSRSMSGRDVHAHALQLLANEPGSAAYRQAESALDAHLIDRRDVRRKLRVPGSWWILGGRAELIDPMRNVRTMRRVHRMHLLIGEHDGVAQIYAFYGKPIVALLTASRSMTPALALAARECVARYQRRVGGPFVLRDDASPHLRTGVNAALMEANVAYAVIAMLASTL